MAKKPIKKLDDIVNEAVKRFEYALGAEEENHKRAKEAIRFRDLEQWPDAIKQSRENDPEGARPCLTLDKINQYLNQVKNDQRQNRPSIKVRPVDDKGDPKVAEIIQGLIRNIEQQSRASIAYDTAHDQALDGGFGYWRVLTEYVDDESFDQEPRIVRIRNRFSVLLDPDHQMPDGSDAKWAIIFEKLTKEEFEAQYPKAKPVSFEEYKDLAPDWCGEDFVIVAEYFRIKKTYEDLVIGDQKRKVCKKKVEWYKLTAAEELDSREIPCDYIPIVQVIGNEIDVEGKRRLSGLVRGAIDSMRMYNYAASSFVEMVALAPRAPWVGAEGQFEGREQDWKTANRRNISALQYKPVIEGGFLVPRPERQAMPGIPTGWQQMMVNLEHDVQASMGMYASNLGEQTSATSGVQEATLQKRGDTATFHYTDNLSLAIEHTGRILLSMIPRLYDKERIVRILGEDGTEDYVRLDPEQETPIKKIIGAEGKKVSYYNIGLGKYDVAVTVGPAFTTKRQEAAMWLTQMVTAKPELMQIVGDLMFKAMDVPYADEAAERMKKLLPPQLQDQEDDDIPPDVKNAIQQAQASLDQQKQAIALAAQELEQMQKTSASEIQQAKDAKADLDKMRVQLQNDQKIMQMTESLITARMEAKEAKQDSEIKDAITTVRELISKHEAQLSAMLQKPEGQEQDDSQQNNELIMASHQQLMEAVQQVLAALIAPRVRQSQVTGPNGVYEMTSTETIA